MKLSIKPAALAVAMALGAAVAQAQTLPSYGTTAPSGDGLYLQIWNAGTNTTDLVNLSSTYSDITYGNVANTGISGTSALTTPNSSFTAVNNFQGHNVLQLNLGTVSNFSSLFGSGSGAAYVVTAVGDNEFSVMTSESSTGANVITAGAVKAMANGIQTEVTNWSSSSNTSPLSDTTGTPNYSVTSGSGGVFDGNDGIVGDNFGADVGSAANFYQAAYGRGTASATTEYTYNGQAGFWFLSSSGDLTWNLISSTVSAVPLPPAVWLFASGLIGLALISRRRQSDIGAAV